MTKNIQKEFLFTKGHTLPARIEPALTQYIAELAERTRGDGKTYEVHEDALLLPRDVGTMEEIKSAAKKYAGPKLKYIVVIGIGGSNLGAKAVYDAIPVSSGRPQLLFLDTLSSVALQKVQESLALVGGAEEILINLISKSGTTVESVANFELLYADLAKRFPDIASRVVCTTDIDSVLSVEASRHGFGLLPIPAPVGGRFSVFSAVGLFPLLLVGIDVEEFCRGGSDMLAAAVGPDNENDAVRAAEDLFVAAQEGQGMFNIFHFNSELESLGKWERQLIAESLGKEKDRDGKVVHAGITPIVSIGSTDLHSMAQLYFGGPRDKFTMLIRADEPASLRVPTEGMLSFSKGVGGKEGGEIMAAIFEGVKGAYTTNKLPWSEVRLSSISPYTLGLYMEWRMATVLYLAKLLNVDPFDQPNVEDYKKVTRAILEQ